MFMLSSTTFAAPARPKAPPRPPPVQPRPLEDDATSRAKAYFKAAETNFSLGRFEEALEGYSKAYQLKPLPALLFNIGQCEFELGNHERAIFFYEQYLRDPEAKMRTLASRRLEEAKAAQAAAEQKRVQDDTQETERQQLAMRVQEQTRLAAAKQAELDAQRLQFQAPPPPTPIYEKWWFWAAAGGVVAVAVTATILATHGTKTVLPQGDLSTIDVRTTP